MTFGQVVMNPRHKKYLSRILSIVLIATSLTALGTAVLSDWVRFSVQVGELHLTATDYHVGEVFRGDVRPFSFAFRNISQHDIEVARTVAACGCTETKVTPTCLAPGQRGKLTGWIHFKGKSGPIKERLLMQTTTGSQYVFTLSAQVREHYDVQPAAVDFGEVWWDDVLRASVLIDAQSLPGGPESLRVMPGHHGSLTAVLTPSQQNQWRLDIVVRDPPGGNYQQQVLVRTNNPRQEDIFIPVHANVRAPVEVKPKTVFLGTAAAGQKLPCRLTLVRRPDLNTEIAHISLSRLSLTMMEPATFTGDRATIVLELRLPPDGGLIEDNLTIETSAPRWVVYVPVVVSISP